MIRHALAAQSLQKNESGINTGVAAPLSRAPPPPRARPSAYEPTTEMIMAKSRRPDLDWQAIENDYRAGILSIRAIARIHGCTHPTIREHAKRYGWKRDLGGRVREATRAKLDMGAGGPSSELSTSHAHATGRTGGEAEAEIIDAASRTQVEVVRGHRQAITLSG
ncbi:MAG: hypothetical protein IH939_05685 [Acidobacteria bacterium]|nr:hypothetical protein [Acidobacteriota bacterium]